MRIVLAVLFTLVAGSAFDTARADPYKWCADYGAGFDGGGTNCYFLTLQQCQWAISGMGGFCRPNGFYTGPDAEARPVKRQKKRS